MPLKTPGMVQSAPAHVEEVISTGRWLEHHLQVRSLAKAIAEAWPSACLCAYISAGACNFKLLTTMSEGAAEQFEIGTRSDYMLRCAASNRLPHVQVSLSLSLHPYLQSIRANVKVVVAGRRKQNQETVWLRSLHTHFAVVNAFVLLLATLRCCFSVDFNTVVAVGVFLGAVEHYGR